MMSSSSVRRRLSSLLRRVGFSSGSIPLSSPSPLVVALLPLRLHFLTFLSDEDVARLLRVGRSTALSFLPGYSFRRHTFEAETEARLRDVTVLYAAYDLRITRLCVFGNLIHQPQKMKYPHSLPSHLTTLLIGITSHVRLSGSIFDDRTMGWSDDGVDEGWGCAPDGVPAAELSDAQYRQLLLQTEAAPVRVFNHWASGPRARMTDPPVPRVLPPTLRRLQIGWGIGAAFRVGCLPAGLQVLQVDELCNESLRALPPALVHLVLGRDFDLSIQPHVLPSTLQALHMKGWNQPLTPGVLPASLRALDLPAFCQPIQPGVLPSSLLHLSLRSFNGPLAVSTLPSSLISLELGKNFRHPLPPLVLPTSLRVFHHSHTTPHPLQPGTLPSGLQVLHWRRTSEDPMDLLPGMLPSGLRVLDLGSHFVGTVAVGAIPDAVRWLRLPVTLAPRRDEQRWSAEAHIVWEQQQDRGLG